MEPTPKKLLDRVRDTILGKDTRVQKTEPHPRSAATLTKQNIRAIMQVGRDELRPYEKERQTPGRDASRCVQSRRFYEINKMYRHHEKRGRLLRHRHTIVEYTDCVRSAIAEALDEITAEMGLQST
jgi:hypothetical protein